MIFFFFFLKRRARIPKRLLPFFVLSRSERPSDNCSDVYIHYIWRETQLKEKAMSFLVSCASYIHKSIYLWSSDINCVSFVSSCAQTFFFLFKMRHYIHVKIFNNKKIYKYIFFLQLLVEHKNKSLAKKKKRRAEGLWSVAAGVRAICTYTQETEKEHHREKKVGGKRDEPFRLSECKIGYKGGTRGGC